MTIQAEKNLVDDGVPVHWMTEQTEIIKADVCQDDELPDSFFENKVVKGLLLSVKHSSSSKSSAKVYSNSSFASSSKMNTKRQRIQSTANYDRMFMFADLLNPPNCFVVFSNATSDSYRYLKHCQNDISVGRLFYIVEPDRCLKTFGEKMPILSSTRPFIPLKYSSDVQPIREVIATIPRFNMTMPKEPGEQLFFVYHGLKIAMSRFEVARDTVSCSGVFCDRSQKGEKNVSCGCMFTGMQGACVGEYTVTMPVPAGISALKTATIPKARSLRTSQIFFDSLMMFGKQTEEQADERFIEVRAAVGTMVDYINEHGGWTVVGWFKKGEVEDSSSGEKVESTTVSLHLSLLIPTDAKIANGKDQEFNTMKIGTAEHVQALAASS